MHTLSLLLLLFMNSGFSLRYELGLPLTIVFSKLKLCELKTSMVIIHLKERMGKDFTVLTFQFYFYVLTTFHWVLTVN